MSGNDEFSVEGVGGINPQSIVDIDNQYDTHYLQKELYELIKFDPLVFEFLQQGALDGVWYWDLENPEHEWMSDKFWQVFGYDPNEKKDLVSEWQEMIFADDLAVVKKNLERHLQNPSYPYDQTVRYRHKDGSTVWVRCRGVAIYNEEGKPFRLLGAHNDVTKLMQQQEHLVKERLDNARLIREATMLKQDVLVLEAELSAVKHRLEKDMLYSDITGFMNVHHFKTLVKMRCSTAHRLKVQANGIVIKIENFEKIAFQMGKEALVSLLATANSLISSAMADSLITQLSDVILLFNIGYSQEELQSIAANILRTLEEHLWVAASPRFSVAVHLRPVSLATNPDTLIQDLIVNAS